MQLRVAAEASVPREKVGSSLQGIRVSHSLVGKVFVGKIFCII